MSSPESATTRALAVPELLLEILSHLERPNLARASLVSRSWSSASEEELYRCPIQPWTEPIWIVHERACLLARTLRCQPELARWVRVLHLDACDYDPTGGSWHSSTVHKSLMLRTKKLRSLELHSDLNRDSIRQLKELFGYAVIALSEIEKLSIDRLGLFNPVGSRLASFQRLTSLHFKLAEFTGWNLTGWRRPSFRLNRLTLLCGLPCRDSPRPGLAELEWLTASSRDSLRHLRLEGFSSDVIADLLTWSGNLETVRVAVPCWAGRDAVHSALEVGRLPGLRRLMLSVGPDALEEERSDDEFDRFAAELRQAATEANTKLGRPIIVVEA